MRHETCGTHRSQQVQKGQRVLFLGVSYAVLQAKHRCRIRQFFLTQMYFQIKSFISFWNFWDRYKTQLFLKYIVLLKFDSELFYDIFIL